MARHLDDNLLLLMVIGTPADLLAGKGETVISVSEAAEVMGVRRQSVLQMISAERLTPVAKFKGEWLFRESDVRRFQEARNQGD